MNAADTPELRIAISKSQSAMPFIRVVAFPAQPNKRSFIYTAKPQRVVFGPGRLADVPAEAERLGIKSPLLLSSNSQTGHAEHVKGLLNGKIAGTYLGAVMHTPIHVTETALGVLKESQADGLISIGGGSVIGLGKALSVRTGLPHITIPTTYSGSETTDHLGETKDGRKTTRSDPRILPATIIYDPELTLSMPPALTATSGINALAHAVEALYAKDINPLISLAAVEGIRTLSRSLPVLVENPSDLQARSTALYGAWLCGTCLASVGMALHHKLCHTLGGSFGMPHSETHTIMLPHSLAYNAPEVPAAMEKIAQALPESGGHAVRGLNELLKQLKVKRALKDFGLKEMDVPKAAEIAVEKPYWNPRKVDQSKLEEVFRRAWAGEEARVDL